MVWVITGDGDALSIGGNHLLHSMRRNVDITLVMFNNRIYGLTKGQASPDLGVRQGTKSTPGRHGRLPDQPADRRARGRGAVRRPLASTPTPSTSSRPSSGPGMHHGSTFVEVLQNCNIFNDGA